MDPSQSAVPSVVPPRLRPPAASLGGCCWLPRFYDKARSHARGELPWMYRVVLGSALGIDGEFLRHFRLRSAATKAALRAAGSDDEALRWFLAQPGVNAGRIGAWNARAVRLGAPGGPMRWSFGLVRRQVYPRVPHGQADNYFDLIAADERLTG